MSPEAWFTVATIGLVIAALATDRIGADTAMVGGLTLLMFGDVFMPGTVLPPEVGIAGFAHPSIVIIGGLFVVAAGLQETGGIEIVARRLLGRPRTIAGAQFRMMVPVSVMSGFMNNTPIVAMYLPIISDWARKLRISPSKLYMPLSFAAIMGGKLTLIGTASNIVIMGLFVGYVTDASGATAEWLAAVGGGELSPRTTFWGVAVLGVPTTFVGIIVVIGLSRWLLPERRPSSQDILDARQYQVEMVVADDAPIVGQSIEQAGLRHLPGLFLTKIERGDRTLPAVPPEERLRAGDRLWFAGILESVVDLRKVRGLLPATNQVKKLSAARSARTLVEAVVAHDSPLVGRSVRASQFRTRYNAAIIAVHRRGGQVEAKVGDIVLRSGDTILLETHSGWVNAFRNGHDFYLVSQVEGSRPVRHERAWIALGILLVVIFMLTATSVSPAITALVGAGLMVLTRCVTGTEARNSVNWQVLLVIGAALGMGAALTESGAADVIAWKMLDIFDGAGPGTMLLVLFLVASTFSQLITAAGSAVLMFPITMVAARDLGVSPVPFVFTLMVAAGSTYLSPVAYQTNLMVYAPGGYRFFDYARLGIPLTISMAIVCALVAPLVFPFLPVGP